jgi:hypothetical protein
MLDFGHTEAFVRTLYDPFERLAQGFTEDLPTGLADGHQAYMSPFLRTVVLQLTHQSGVRQDDQMHVPGLAHAAPELTLAHAQMLLPVPMEGLGSCPALPVGLEDTMHFPIGPIGDQDLARFLSSFGCPQHHNPHRMVHVGQTNALGEIPLRASSHRDLLAASGQQLPCNPVAGFPLAPFDDDLAIGFQVAHIATLLGMHVVDDLGIGEVTIKRNITRDVLTDHPIDQFDAQVGMRVEVRLTLLALLTLAKTAEVQWIVLAAGMNVVGEQVIVGNQVAFVSMIPEPASVFNQLAIMVDQGVINRDDAILTIAGGRIALQPLQAMGIDALDIPRGLGQEAVEAGLVGGCGKLARDAADGLMLGDEQASQILGKMTSSWFIGEDVAELEGVK